MHTKAVIVDRRILFVGSLNLDPRSIDLNTEMGLFLESEEAAGGFAEQVDDDLPAYTYTVQLDDAGSVVWRYEGGEKVAMKTSEPDVGVWRAFKSDFFGMLPLEDQL